MDVLPYISKMFTDCYYEFAAAVALSITLHIVSILMLNLIHFTFIVQIYHIVICMNLAMLMGTINRRKIYLRGLLLNYEIGIRKTELRKYSHIAKLN